MVNHKRYITRKRARIEGICGKVNIPYGTALETEDGYLLYEGSRLCAVTSQNAYDYFQPRRRRAWAGARRPGGRNPRPPGEKGTQTTSAAGIRSGKALCVCGYKRPDCEDFFIWGYDFYNAPIDDLKAIAEIVGYNPSALDKARR